MPIECAWPLGKQGPCKSKSGFYKIRERDGQEHIICDRHRLDAIRSWNWESLEPVKSETWRRVYAE